MKSMRAAKAVGKKVFASADVQLRAEEKLMVSAPGFLFALDCISDEWGCVTVPSIVWSHILKVSRYIGSDELTIIADDGLISIDTFRIKNKMIRCSFYDKMHLEISIDANLQQACQLVDKYDIVTIKTSPIYKTLKIILCKFRSKLFNAADILMECGITPEDIATMVASKMKIHNYDEFIQLLEEASDDGDSV